MGSRGHGPMLRQGRARGRARNAGLHPPAPLRFQPQAALIPRAHRPRARTLPLSKEVPNALTGVVERIIFLNEENHYTIAEFRPDPGPADPAFPGYRVAMQGLDREAREAARRAITVTVLPPARRRRRPVGCGPGCLS